MIEDAEPNTDLSCSSTCHKCLWYRRKSIPAQHFSGNRDFTSTTWFLGSRACSVSRSQRSTVGIGDQFVLSTKSFPNRSTPLIVVSWKMEIPSWQSVTMILRSCIFWLLPFVTGEGGRGIEITKRRYWCWLIGVNMGIVVILSGGAFTNKRTALSLLSRQITANLVVWAGNLHCECLYSCTNRSTVGVFSLIWWMVTVQAPIYCVRPFVGLLDRPWAESSAPHRIYIKWWMYNCTTGSSTTPVLEGQLEL
jgi:hypothetical protein